MEWPGLGQQVKDICKEKGLPDATKEEVVMEKETVNDKESILMSHLKYLKAEMKGRMVETMSKTGIRRRREYTSTI